MQKTINVAICYDFDGTLCIGNMQEYGFMKQLKMAPAEFWNKCDTLAHQNSADPNLSYMKCMLDEAKARNLVFRKQDFADCGRDIKLFAGVAAWFDRINAYALKKGVVISHYLISSGLEEIIAGTPIYAKFHKVFAGCFMYNGYGEAIWPARTVNYTEKTQYIFRINKGMLDISDDVNAAMSVDERPIPFANMIYFGDGHTDVPCMSMLKHLGGHCIAVYNPRQTTAQKQALQLKIDGRVDLVAPANYSAGSSIDRYVKRVINKICADYALKECC
ncbi:MAG: haloacid dehalogenase-like hydrolase [Alphaproteobacteria bacterium]|nr:haloacid dehalogenase-like hydrolase [Alphaproteobacteria bacterium]